MKIKTRLIWFGVGILVGGAAISHFIWRGLRSDRYALLYETKLQLAALEARVLKLEAVSFPKSNPAKVVHGRISILNIHSPASILSGKGW